MIFSNQHFCFSCVVFFTPAYRLCCTLRFVLQNKWGSRCLACTSSRSPRHQATGYFCFAMALSPANTPLSIASFAMEATSARSRPIQVRGMDPKKHADGTKGAAQTRRSNGHDQATTERGGRGPHLLIYCWLSFFG